MMSDEQEDSPILMRVSVVIPVALGSCVELIEEGTIVAVLRREIFDGCLR